MNDQPIAACQHGRYSIDTETQRGRCVLCGAEGRMEFVVPSPRAGDGNLPPLPEPQAIPGQAGNHSVWWGRGYTADHMREYARAALAAAPAAAPAWQPIETAPKDGSLFLCWVLAVRYGETDEGQQYQEDVSQADFCHWQSHDDAPDGGWFEPCCGQIGDGQDVTHWMPLPAAPAFEAPATGPEVAP